MLALVTPAHGRYAVTRLALAQRAHLAGELAGRGLSVLNVVVADDENLDIARCYGFDTVEQDNTQVGRKWNDGIEYAAREGAQYIAVVGSDDWVHPDVFSRLPADEPGVPDFAGDFITWGDGPEVVAGRELTLVDLPTGRMRACWAPRKPCIPWVMPRVALEPSGFRPVAERASIGLDGSLLAGLGITPTWVVHDPRPHARVDFKSALNLNAYDAIAGAIGVGEETDHPWPELARHYPEDLVVEAFALSVELGSPV